MLNFTDKCNPQAWLGYYNSSKLFRTKEELVAQANDFALKSLCLDAIPALEANLQHLPLTLTLTLIPTLTPTLIEAKTVGKMGLRGTPGLVVNKGPSAPAAPARGGGGSRGRKRN